MWATSLPKPTGAFCVFSKEYLLKDEDSQRQVLVKCWFPVEQKYVKENKTHPLLPDSYLSTFATVAANVPVFVAKILGRCHTNSFRSCEKSAFDNYSQNSIPVFIHSHGLYGTPHLYTSVAEEAASRGYFVVSPFHTDGSAFDVQYPDKTCLKFENPTTKGDELRQFRKDQLLKRVKDISFLLDCLEQLQTQNNKTQNLDDLDLIAPFLNLKSVVAAGHSFGGGTIFQALMMEPRLRSGVAHDGWFLPLFSLKEQPAAMENKQFLFMDSDYWQNDENRQYRREFLQHLVEEHKAEPTVYLYVVPKTTHQNFCDIAAMLPSLGPIMKLVSRDVPPVKTLSIINQQTLDFLQKSETPTNPPTILKPT